MFVFLTISWFITSICLGLRGKWKKIEGREGTGRNGEEFQVGDATFDQSLGEESKSPLPPPLRPLTSLFLS